MKRYIVALAVLMCAWSWCAEAEDVNLVTGETELEAQRTERIESVSKLADFMSSPQADLVADGILPMEFEILRAEMIDALKEAKKRLEKKGAVITGYEMNGASAAINYYYPLTKEQEAENKEESEKIDYWQWRILSYSEVVYPPELVKMIEELEK